MSIRSITNRILMSIGLLSCLFAVSVDATEWGVVSPPEWAQAAPADYPEIDAIILRDSSHASMIESDWDSPGGRSWTIEIARHMRKKILTPAGIDLAGNAEFRYHKSYDLVTVQAHTIQPDGTIIPVPEDQFLTKEINDNRVVSFAFLQVDSGCVVEYNYELAFNGYFSSHQWQFGNELYTLESVFTLRVAGGFEYTYATSNVPESASRPVSSSETVLHQGKTNSYTWRMHDIMPLTYEPYMSSLNDYVPSLIIQMTRYRGAWYFMDAARDWKELGESFGGFLNEYCSKPRGFRKDVRDLIKSAKTDYDRSHLLYNFVVKEFQRTGREFTMNFEHDNMKALYKERHGTGSEKNILLWALLRQAGIKAWPVLISTRDHGQLPPGVFRIDQFNHVVLFCEVEQGGIYLDASSPYCPYGMLPSQCRTEAGLMVDGDKSALVRIVTSDPVSIRADIARLYLDADGNATCSLTSVFTGYLAIEYGSDYESSDPEEFIKDRYLDSPGFEYTLDSYSCALDSLGRFMVTSVIGIPRAASLLGDHLSATIYQPMLGYNPFVRERRLFPVDFNYPQTYQNIVKIYPPEGYAIQELPEPIQFSVDGLTYTRIPQAIEGGAAWDCKIQIDRPRFEVEEYPIIKEFFEKMTERGHEELLFTSES